MLLAPSGASLPEHSVTKGGTRCKQNKFYFNVFSVLNVGFIQGVPKYHPITLYLLTVKSLSIKDTIPDHDLVQRI